MKTIRLKLINSKLIAFTISISFSQHAYCEDYYFDSSLFKGSAFGQNIEQFNQNATPAGNYLVDIYLNNKRVTSGVKIAFIQSDLQQDAEPCLPSKVVALLQLKVPPTPEPEEQCHPLGYWSSDGHWQFDPASLQLQLTIPNSSLDKKPRGYIPTSEWEEGISAVFLRHNTNYTWTENRTSDYRYQYLWSGITAGTNLMKWQFRHRVMRAISMTVQAAVDTVTTP